MATAWAARHGLTSDQYQVEFDKLGRPGLPPGPRQRLHGERQRPLRRHLGEVAQPGWVARHGMTAAQYQAEFDKLVGQGFRLVEVSGYTVNGQDRYAAIWDKTPSPGWSPATA